LRTHLDGLNTPIDVELSHRDPAARDRKAGDRLRLAFASYGLFPRSVHTPPRHLPDVTPNAPAEYRERGRNS
jgi:hypothetical protein